MSTPRTKTRKTVDDFLVEPLGNAPAPWPWQSDGAAHLALHPKAYLDVPMGGGKTRMALDALESGGVGSAVVLCPKHVVDDVWPSQFATWAKRSWTVVPITALKGNLASRVERLEKLRLSSRAIGRPFAVVMNYEAFRSPAIMQWMQKAPKWGALLYDEAQKLKSARGKTSKVAARVSKNAERVIGMSGTPMPHSPLDVFGQFRAIAPWIYGTSFVRFRNEFALMGGYLGKQVIGYRNNEELVRRMGEITFRVNRADIDLGLKGSTHQVVHVDLSREARALYDSLKAGVIAEHEAGQINAANGLVKLLRMQQLCSGLAVLDDAADEEGNRKTPEQVAMEIATGDLSGREMRVVCNAKRDALAEILASTDEPVVVMGQFRRDMDVVHEAADAAGVTSLELSGRRKELAEWKAGGAQVLAAQIRSSGEGISLVRAPHHVYLSTGFDMGLYEQSLARTQRPGQTSHVSYYHIRARDSVDDYVAKVLAQRGDLVAGVLAMLTMQHPAP